LNAAHVTKLQLTVSRVVVNAMEPRSALAIHNTTTGRFTIHVESQGVFGMRGDLAFLMGVPAKQIRVLTGQVGGSFGMKALGYGEYVAILRAAEALGRPVKWTDTRSESFVRAATWRSTPSLRSTRMGGSSPPALPAMATSAPICRRFAC